MLHRLSLVVFWCLCMLVSSAAPTGGVREERRECAPSCNRELEVEPLPVEDFARELRVHDFLSA
ncbi:hypothetical protein FIBSPDRAFT_869298 [Athelia psychrophila]|uniref:Uncharacterized protein n=1 Tax=Athelia psychrophila TaxID=1759441 RepID=A0A166CB86_9AGAM|nr:hypothetical protein FIBSPDRAFT_869298 [Fibularhizoctonia sp. CBS 109695]